MSDYIIFLTAIDGYAQLPLFVDNITPVNAEGLNRIRSAIINIENALGIIPQGEYQTVSERLDNIDSGGLETIVERLDLIEAELDVVEATLADFPSDLATVLAAGNVTGGSNIIVSTGDRIEGESSVDITANSGDINLTSDKISITNGGSGADLVVSSTNPNGLISSGPGSLALDTNGNLFVGQGGTSWNALANRFDPINSVFDAAATLPELYDFLAETSQTEYDNGAVPVEIYVDSVSGNDDDGDGTIANPFRTFKRAKQVIPSTPLRANPAPLAKERVIKLIGAGPYNAGGMTLSDLSYVKIEGEEPTVVHQGPINSLVSSTEADGLVIQVPPATFTADEHRGRIIKFLTGTLAGQFGIITRNTTNQLWVTQDTRNATFRTPGTGAVAPAYDYEILDWVTQWDFPESADNIFMTSNGSSFKYIKFIPNTSSSLFQNPTLFVNNSGKIEFDKCRFELSSIVAGRAGSIFLTTCSVSNKGNGFSDYGMVSATAQGMVKLQSGTFIDGGNPLTPTNRWISALSMGLIESQGEVAFRDLDQYGITVRGSGVTTFHERRGSIFNIWRFDNCAAALRVNNKVSAIPADIGNEGWGWAPLDLPDLHGAISGPYCVTASGGARIRLGANSTITDGTGTTTVSADDGATASSEDPDGTFIQGGIPATTGVAFIKDIAGGGGWPTTTATDSFGDSYEAAEVASANGYAVIIPNGTGSIQTAIADGTATGGNSRGDYAVDLQLSRNAANEVASGNYSFAAGNSNVASGSYAVAAGFGNTADGLHSVACGASSLSDHESELAHGSGQFATAGDAQYSRMVLRQATLDATTKELNTTGGAASTSYQSHLGLNDDTAYRFRIDAVAREDATGDTAWWEISGCIKRGSGAASTSLVGSLHITTDYDAGASSWQLSVTADAVNGLLKLEATGEAAKTIRWVATIHSTKVSG